MLAAWLGDPQRAEDIVARRAAGLVACDDLPPCTTRAQHYRVQVTAGVGRVRRRVEAIVWAVGQRAARDGVATVGSVRRPRLRRVAAFCR